MNLGHEEGAVESMERATEREREMEMPPRCRPHGSRLAHLAEAVVAIVRQHDVAAAVHRETVRAMETGPEALPVLEACFFL